MSPTPDRSPLRSAAGDRPQRGILPAAAAAALGLALAGTLGAQPPTASAPGPPPASSPAATPAPPTHSLTGRVDLVVKGKVVRDRSANPRDVLVYFEPTTKIAPPKPVRAEMVTRKKAFEPRLLVVPVGSTVAFPNQDPILHNVFSVSGGNGFDLGLIGKGAGKAATFREPGLVRVFCNVHHSMIAYVMVVGSGFWVQPDAEGHFTLAGLPAGPGKLTVWHEQAEPRSFPVTLPAAGPATVRLEIVLPRVPAHLNKLGQPYASRSGNYE